MNIVNIFIAIAKPGEICFVSFDNRRRMALETEAILFSTVRGVKGTWILLYQQAVIPPAMGLVTHTAFLILYRGMPVRILRKMLFEIYHLLAVLIHEHVHTVAADTQMIREHLESLAGVAAVGVMTIDAPTFARQRAVLNLGAAHRFLNILMA
jgi:hypothetical protein